MKRFLMLIGLRTKGYCCESNKQLFRWGRGLFYFIGATTACTVELYCFQPYQGLKV